VTRLTARVQQFHRGYATFQPIRSLDGAGPAQELLFCSSAESSPKFQASRYSFTVLVLRLGILTCNGGCREDYPPFVSSFYTPREAECQF
jgi:hypothetical protein